MANPMLYAILATALAGSISCAWREVADPRSATLSGNYTGLLREGDIVELVCTTSGLLSTTTVRWTSRQGNVHLNAERGYSPLALALPVTRELHGASFYCTGPFSERAGDRIFPYNVVSDAVTLRVEGVDSPYEPYRPGHIEMESSAGTEHRVGDVVQYTCSTYDIPFTVVDVFQAKGNYEVQLHTGWQPWRRVSITMTAADHGSEVYCRLTTTDPDDRVLYSLVSNRVPVHIVSD